MQLGLAKRRLAKGEDVGDLVAGADAGAARRDRRAARPRARHPPGRADRSRARAGAARPRDARRRARRAGRRCPTSGSPEPVEAAAYFTVSEALTNVAQVRAGDGRARRGRRRSDGMLAIAVADDGVGGARPPAAARACAGSPTGSARSAATLDVDSPPGAGTTPARDHPAATRRRAEADRVGDRRAWPPARRRRCGAGCCSRTPSSTRS